MLARSGAHPIRLLAIGHSYVLAVNRATIREVARDPSFDITVAAPSFYHGDLRPIHCEPEPHGSPLRLVPIPARWTSRVHVFHYAQKPLRDLARRHSFQGVFAWEEPYIFSGYQLAQLAQHSGARFSFYTCQNLDKKYPPPFGYLERICLSATDRWVAAGQSVFDVQVHRGYVPERGSVIALAVDTTLFRPADEERRQQVRRTLGLTKPVIGYMGRLVEAKGLRVLMQALEALDPAIPWSLLLLGSGEWKGEIEQWAERFGWADRVKILLARHDEVPNYLGAMDMLVAPSQTRSNWKEQFGRMLIEAFACGVPVIASDSGEIPYVVGDAGIILPEKDVAAWTKSIELLLVDPALRQRLAEAGLQRVSRFSVVQSAAHFRNFYRDLVYG
ncbi:MAG TPA: glycosyltransferase [Bryobacteraceae bacterium]|nr:glycosyltransferase [Bryobacteraceae bacterium]